MIGRALAVLFPPEHLERSPAWFLGVQAFGTAPWWLAALTGQGVASLRTGLVILGVANVAAAYLLAAPPGMVRRTSHRGDSRELEHELAELLAPVPASDEVLAEEERRRAG